MSEALADTRCSVCGYEVRWVPLAGDIGAYIHVNGYVAWRDARIIRGLPVAPDHNPAVRSLTQREASQ